MSVLGKYKDSSFVEHIWENLVLSTIVVALIFLIIILLSRALY